MEMVKLISFVFHIQLNGLNYTHIQELDGNYYGVIMVMVLLNIGCLIKVI